jgi:arylsulfatase A-like enzyme
MPSSALPSVGSLFVAIRFAITCLLCFVTLQDAQSNETLSPKKQPNIVYVLCDDLGVGDLKAFNPKSKIATPAMDRLAAQGMRFTDAHSGSAVCTPTRYGILCGRYAWRTKLQNGVLGGLSPSLIAPDQSTVPKFLKANGYHSACIGKWHLGLDWKKLAGKSVSELSIETLEQNRNVDYSQPFQAGPLQAGFDEYFGISGSLDMVPYVYLKDRAVTELPSVEKSFGMRSASDKSHTRLGPAASDFTAWARDASSSASSAFTNPGETETTADKMRLASVANRME